MSKTVKLPAELLEKIWDISRAMEEIQDELEDYLTAQDPEFLERMRTERNNHGQGFTKPLDALKKVLCTQ